MVDKREKYLLLQKFVLNKSYHFFVEDNWRLIPQYYSSFNGKIILFTIYFIYNLLDIYIFIK